MNWRDGFIIGISLMGIGSLMEYAGFHYALILSGYGGAIALVADLQRMGLS